MKLIAIIPARGGSKGIPRKNIKYFNNEPLISWTIKSAIESNLFDSVFVSTDDPEIASISLKYGAMVPFLRPKYLAKDTSTTLSVVQHFIKKVYNSNKKILPDAVVILQPTSPLRTVVHLKQAIKLFKSNKDADSLVSCVEVPHNFVPESLMKINKKGFIQNLNNGIKQIYRRQDKEKYFARNGAAIYITKTKLLNKFILGGNILPYFMSSMDSVDIDNKYDWELAEIIFKNRENV